MQSVDAAGLSIGDDDPPRIMGVVNLSRESPYEPSVFTEPDAAAAYIDEELIDPGADIIDVGLESANKRFEVLSAEAELSRLDLAIETIASVSGDAVFSIETRYAAVANTALDAGFDMVNDICGFADPDLPAVCRDHDVAVVKMAGPGDIERPGALTSVDEIYDALAAAPLTDKTIIDPAFGGWSEDKTLETDRETFRRLREFRAIGHPILVSVNRKNFLRHLADRRTDEALPVSLAATALAVERGARVIRTHDVAATRDAAIIGREFVPTTYADPELGVRELDVRGPDELARYLQQIGAGTALAADGTTKAFELRGIDPLDRSLLAHVTDDIGGTLAEGKDDDVLILLATPRMLQRIRTGVGDESTRLARLLDRLVEVNT